MILKLQKGNKLIPFLSKFASKYTSGLIPQDKVDMILEHPADYMRHIYSEDELNNFRNNLYQNYYPSGYFGTEGIKMATEIMQGLPPSKKTSWLREYTSNELSSKKEGSEKARDTYFAEWLGIPEKQRRFKNILSESPYKPTSGNLDPNLKIFKISDNVVPNKSEQIVNSYYAAKNLSNNKFINEGMRPIKGTNNYVIHPGIHLLFGDNPTSKKQARKLFNKYVESKASNYFANGLGAHTVGSAIDPNKGQYISIFDKWDINPLHEGYDKDIRKLNKIIDVPLNFDATGGIGKPFYIYDRVYLDDYYGVNSKPEKDSYYGGYLDPAIKIE